MGASYPLPKTGRHMPLSNVDIHLAQPQNNILLAHWLKEGQAFDAGVSLCSSEQHFTVSISLAMWYRDGKIGTFETQWKE